MKESQSFLTLFKDTGVLLFEKSLVRTATRVTRQIKKEQSHFHVLEAARGLQCPQALRFTGLVPCQPPPQAQGPPGVRSASETEVALLLFYTAGQAEGKTGSERVWNLPGVTQLTARSQESKPTQTAWLQSPRSSPGPGDTPMPVWCVAVHPQVQHFSFDCVT